MTPKTSHVERSAAALFSGLRRAIGTHATLEVVDLYSQTWAGDDLPEARHRARIWLFGRPSAAVLLQLLIEGLNGGPHDLGDGHSLTSFDVLDERRDVDGTFLDFEAVTRGKRASGGEAPKNLLGRLLEPLKSLLRAI